jgi:hypothetical protein
MGWVGSNDVSESPGCRWFTVACERRRETSPSTFCSSRAVLETGDLLMLRLRVEAEVRQSFFRRWHLF